MGGTYAMESRKVAMAIKGFAEDGIPQAVALTPRYPRRSKGAQVGSYLWPHLRRKTNGLKR